MASYATLDDFGRRTQSGIEDSLFPGEEFRGAIDAFDALRPSRRTKLILTDQRLLAFKRGLVRQSMKDFDCDRISTVEFKKGIIYRKLSVDGSGFSKQWTIVHGDGQQFAAALRKQDTTPVFDRTTDATSTKSGTSAEGPDDPASTVSVSGSEGTTRNGEPYLVNPEVEVFGFNKWHYAAIGGAVIGYLGLAADVSAIVSLSLLATGAFLYLDNQYMQEASTWQPRIWVYLVGLLVAFLSLPVYLYKRHQVVSRTESQSDTQIKETT